MFADAVAAGMLERFSFQPAGWSDGDAVREGILAVAALAVYLITAPPKRRRLALQSILLLGLATIALLASVIFPKAVASGAEPGAGHAHHVLRFFLVASLLQSVLLIVVVSIWERLGQPLPKIFRDILRTLMLAVALLTILWDAGINAGELVTGSAVVTAVLGFALKDTLGNVFAGLAIHVEHPFEVGDWIQYDANQAHIGKVIEINWRATKVLTLDEAFVIVPNGQLAQASIRNFTKPEPWSRRSIYVVTPYEVSPQKVQKVILDAIRGSFGVLETPAPSVVTSNFTERGVEHWVRLFTTDFDKRDRVDGMARDRIWFALARHGIEIPTATQAIRLTQVAPPALPEEAGNVVARRMQSLEEVGLLDSLSEQQIRRLASDCRELRFAAGEPVIRQGEPGGSMFVILHGSVDVTAVDKDVGPVELARLGPGEFFGEMSLMAGAPRSATVTAFTEVTLLEVDKEAFRHVLDAEPELVETLGTALTHRLEERAQALARGGRRPEAPPPDLFQRIREFFAT